MCHTSLPWKVALKTYQSIVTTRENTHVTCHLSAPAVSHSLKKRCLGWSSCNGLCLFTVTTVNKYILNIHNEPGSVPDVGSHLTASVVNIPAAWRILIDFHTAGFILSLRSYIKFPVQCSINLSIWSNYSVISYHITLCKFSAFHIVPSIILSF